MLVCLFGQMSLVPGKVKSVSNEAGYFLDIYSQRVNYIVDLYPSVLVIDWLGLYYFYCFVFGPSLSRYKILPFQSVHLRSAQKIKFLWGRNYSTKDHGWGRDGFVKLRTCWSKDEVQSAQLKICRRKQETKQDSDGTSCTCLSSLVWGGKHFGKMDTEFEKRLLTPRCYFQSISLAWIIHGKMAFKQSFTVFRNGRGGPSSTMGTPPTQTGEPFTSVRKSHY